MTLQTERLTLRRLRACDDDALVALLRDERVGETYMVPPLATDEAAKKLALRLRALSEGDAHFVRGICLGDTMIGMINDTERTQDTVEIGYALLPPYWGRGYATEALTAVIAAMHDAGFREVIAGAFEHHAASLRVMQKCGMTPSDRRATVEYRGVLHRCIYYSSKKSI